MKFLIISEILKSITHLRVDNPLNYSVTCDSEVNLVHLCDQICQKPPHTHIMGKNSFVATATLHQ